MTVCILVMCGLPASGKTTLVSQFQATVSQDLTCYVVDYDRLMPTETEKTLIQNQTNKGTELSLWKKYREGIVDCVDHLLQLITEQNHKPCVQSELATVPTAGSKSCPVALSCFGVGQLWKKFSDVLVLNDTPTDGRSFTVVVVDDNMYYRSMRYDYYQLARKYCLGFCQVFVDCPSEIALSRNQQRMFGRVDEGVIEAMATKMEVPDTAAHHWEKHSLVLSSDCEDKCSKIQSLVRSAMLDPVLALVEDLEEKAESRHICSANTIHQADQIIRKLLAQHMKEAKGKQQTKEEMKRLSAKLSEVKTDILNKMRSGVITFDLDVKDASKEEDSALFKYLKELFQSRVSEMS